MGQAMISSGRRAGHLPSIHLGQKILRELPEGTPGKLEAEPTRK